MCVPFYLFLTFELTFFGQPANNVTELTVIFTSLVMFSATQGEHHYRHPISVVDFRSKTLR